MEKKEQKEEDPIVIMRADMHCNACQRKINKVLKNFPGVEKVDLNVSERKVIVKGKVDAKSIFEALKKKCGKRTTLIYPVLLKGDEPNKEDTEKPKEEILPDVTVELKVMMHCDACAKAIKKMLLNVNGVAEVHENMIGEKVVVKGKALKAESLCEKVRKAGKHCQIVLPPPPASAQNNEKDEEAKGDVKQTEEKKEEAKGQKPEGTAAGNDSTLEIRREVYPAGHYHTIHQYVYPPQLFSDENPNSCMIM